MASDPQFDIRVRGGSSPNGGYMSLPALMDAILGGTAGLFPERAVAGWTGIQNVHFAVRPLVGVASTSGGGLDAFVPKEGLPVIVTRTTIVVITKSAGAATVDIGVATNGTTASDNLIDGADVGTSGSVAFDNITDVSTNGKSRQYMAVGQSLTVTGLADTTGFVGVVYYEFIKI